MQFAVFKRLVCWGVMSVACLMLGACGSRGLVRSELGGGAQSGPRQVVLVPPDFVITEITFGKTEERVVSAERRATTVLNQHVKEMAAKDKGFAMVDFQQFDEAERADLLQHRALFATMVSQMLLVKEGTVEVWSDKAKYFDYALGDGLADMARVHGVDTVVFVVGKDKVRSLARKMLDSVNAILPLGESLSSQPAVVVVGVVDPRTGYVLMFDAEMASRKALTDDDDVRAMAETVLTDFRQATKRKAGM